MPSLDAWIDRQYRHAAAMMLTSISPVDLVKERPGFGQVIRPRRGSIVASPILAAWDPEPDYFFHWYRDSAIVMDALRLLFEDGSLGAEAVAMFGDFVTFSEGLAGLDGRDLARAPAWRENVSPEFAAFLRTDADLAATHGDAIAADTRVNPDGTLDISTWGRPQTDGSALRALALLRWTRSGAAFDADLATRVASLLRGDLAFVARHWRAPSIDPWEEESGRHYFNLRVQAAALDEGAAWLRDAGDGDLAARHHHEAGHILRLLDTFWLDAARIYQSRLLDTGDVSPKAADIAVILATNHAGGHGPTHSVRDEKVHLTLARLEAIFEADYVINHARPPGRAPALGRYPGDIYMGGNPWHVTTLAAAEFCFRAAAALDDAALADRGNAYLETIRAHTPDSGDMSEQFDRVTGEPRSARHLAWSYAAFVSCIAARRVVTR